MERFKGTGAQLLTFKPRFAWKRVLVRTPCSLSVPASLLWQPLSTPETESLGHCHWPTKNTELKNSAREAEGSLCYEKLSTCISCRCMLQLGNKRAGLRKNNKISRTCTNKSLFFAYATCVGRATSYGRLEAIFILYQSECDREMSIWNECELSEEEEWRKPGSCF